MKQKIYSYIQQNQIINSGDYVLAGVSGGADSVCLFLVLTELQKSIGFELEVIHVEHGIRGDESQKDADFTKKLCECFGVKCNVVHVDVLSYARENGLGLEEAARILRYQEFRRRAKAVNAKVALAHHKEDNAETVLFQMIRGSGLHGMTGIKPIRHDDGVCYIRPLLCVRRCEIEEYLRGQNQEYCIDSTNCDTDYDRNRLRHLVLPELEKINSQAVSHINRTALRLSVIEDYVNEQVQIAVGQILRVKDDRYTIDIEGLMGLHEAIRDECILEIIGAAAGKKKDIGEVHVRSLLELCYSQSGKRIDLPYGIIAFRQYDEIVLSQGTLKQTKTRNNISEYEISKELLESIRESGKEYILEIDGRDEKFVINIFKFDGDLQKIPQKPYTKWLCYDNIRNNFILRKRASGDYIINDSDGHRKKIKELFINEKIPADKRDDVWLLADGSEIAVVFGVRISERYKLTADTKEVLEVRYCGGNSDGFFEGV